MRNDGRFRRGIKMAHENNGQFLGVQRFDFCQNQFHTFLPRYYADMIQVRIENPESFFRFFFFEQNGSTNPQTRRVPTH